MLAPRVSIVIPTYRRAQALRECLASIAGAVHMAHEVICVTVADDPETQALLADAPVTNIIEPDRTGFVKASNAGFRAAKGEYVTQINDDNILMPHTIANAIRFLEAPMHAHIGQAAFFHDSPVRRNVHAQIQVENIWYYVCHVRGLCYANYGLARRELYEQLGYFDERYFMYGADPDFSLKVWHEASQCVAACPGALIRHKELDDDRAKVERAEQGTDNEKLFAKWGLDG